LVFIARDKEQISKPKKDPEIKKPLLYIGDINGDTAEEVTQGEPSMTKL